MRVPRLYVKSDLAPGKSITLDEQAHRHAVQVLRLRAGSRVVLFNGDGREYPGELNLVERHHSLVSLTAACDRTTDSPLEVELVLGIAKGERMDYGLQKATELGVTSVQPVFTAHGVVAPSADRMRNRVKHWEGVIISACEQSGRARLPMLRAPMDIRKWLDEKERRRTGFVLDPTATAGLSSVRGKPDGAPIYVLIGPEGGLSPTELEGAEHSGLTRLRLGPRILRTETAAAAMLAAVQLYWGDLAV